MFFANFLSLYALKGLFSRFAPLLFMMRVLFFASRHLDNDARLLLLDNGYRLWLGRRLRRLRGLDRFWCRRRCDGGVARKVVGCAVGECHIDAAHRRQYAVRECAPHSWQTLQLLLLLHRRLVAADDVHNSSLVGYVGLLNGTLAVAPRIGRRGKVYARCRMLFLDVCSHRFGA